jgi:diguanylate cyclase (GGDEF)-like protein
MPAVLFLDLLIALAFSLADFQRERKAALLRLDSELYAAATSLDLLLGRDFHDIWSPDRPIPVRRYDEITDDLNRFAAVQGIEYVYSMVKLGDTVYFVVSNETSDDRRRHTPSVFYNPYPSPPEDLLSAFGNRRTEFFYYSSYTNIWDSYYSIFIPRTSPGGTLYVLAADIKLADQKALLAACLGREFALAFVLLIPFALSLWFFRSMTREREVALRHHLYRDSLTGLRNRIAFDEDLHACDSGEISLILFNVDTFREINDFLGESAGDEILLRIADVILGKCSGGDLSYRLSADEFLVVPDRASGALRSRADLAEFARSVIGAISSEAFGKTGQPIDLTVRAGLVFRAVKPEKALAFANRAVASAKETHQDMVTYSDAINSEKRHFENFFWLNKLKDAIREDRIVPYYQPIFGNRTGRPEMYESLVRMIDTDGSEILPGLFLEVAKRSRLYRAITHTMIRKTLADFSGMRLAVSINVTARDIADEETVAIIFDSVRKYSMQGRLIVELVESESLTRSPGIGAFIARARSCGIRVAIDDFGSGFSNFEYLSKIDADYIKIDGAIVRDFLARKESSAIVSAIASFAKELGIPVIAEYVSNDGEIERLRELGIEYSQGFYLGKPMPFATLLESHLAARKATTEADAM